MPRQVVLISSEVIEEVHDLLDLLEASEAIGHTYVMVPPHVEEALALSGRDGYTVVTAQYAEFGNTRAKVFGLIRFVAEVARIRPDVIVSGYPMFKHRLAAWLLRRAHISYLRGLMFDSEQRSGFSDRLQASKLARLLPRRLQGSFEADAVLTVSSINADFLRARNVSGDRIHLVGPVWLSKLSSQAGVARDDQKVVTVCTSALAAHGYVDEHAQQVDLLAALIESAGSELAIRPHPRDFYDYERDERFAGTAFDRSSTTTFLDRTRPGDLIFTQLSTLAFEAAFLGAEIAFYTLDSSSAAATVLARRGLASQALTPEAVADPTLADVADVFSPTEMTVLPRILTSIASSDARRRR